MMKHTRIKWKKWIMGMALVLLITAASLQDANAAGAASVYKYGNFAVTALTSTSVTIDYRNLYYDNAASGATLLGYDIYMEDSTAFSGEKLIKSAAANEVYGTISGLISGHYYHIRVDVKYQYSGSTPGYVPYYIYFTAPSAGQTADVDVVSDTSTPTTTQQPGTQATTNPGSQNPSASSAPSSGLAVPQVASVKMVADDVGVVLNGVACDGYEYGIFKKSSNSLVQSDTTSLSSTTFYGLSRKSVYYVKARAYAYDSNGEKMYSAWSSKKYFVPQPEINKTGSKLKKNSIKLKWAKVTGASKYTIYMRKKGGSKWSKVKTVKGKKGSCKITKYKGKSFNIQRNNYELKIKASAKIGGKTYNSTTNNYIYTYTYTRYSY